MRQGKPTVVFFALVFSCVIFSSFCRHRVTAFVPFISFISFRDCAKVFSYLDVMAASGAEDNEVLDLEANEDDSGHLFSSLQVVELKDSLGVNAILKSISDLGELIKGSGSLPINKRHTDNVLEGGSKKRFKSSGSLVSDGDTSEFDPSNSALGLSDAETSICD